MGSLALPNLTHMVATMMTAILRMEGLFINSLLLGQCQHQHDGDYCNCLCYHMCNCRRTDRLPNWPKGAVGKPEMVDHGSVHPLSCNPVWRASGRSRRGHLVLCCGGIVGLYHNRTPGRAPLARTPSAREILQALVPAVPQRHSLGRDDDIGLNKYMGDKDALIPQLPLPILRQVFTTRLAKRQTLGFGDFRAECMSAMDRQD
ncbi:hypothetical protein PSACC_00236, partial [Paramicrosporidium saccamoebae]